MRNNPLTAMSFNVYVGNPTQQRKNSVLHTILKYKPDTFGVQEASPLWMSFFDENLSQIYSYVGNGREGETKGEHNAIFYKKDRFDIVEQDTKWLSDTPTIVSKFPESGLVRIFTYVILLEKESKIPILVINTHLDHSGPIARNKQIPVILDFIKNFPQYPVIFTGDLNDTPESEVYSSVSKLLSDSMTLVEGCKDVHTFHNYGNNDITLDYIFVTSQYVYVSDYQVVTDKINGILPSDHYPVLIKYQIDNINGSIHSSIVREGEDSGYST